MPLGKGALFTARGAWRRYVIVEAAVLVIRDHQQHLVESARIPDEIADSRDEFLPVRDVGRRVIVVRGLERWFGLLARYIDARNHYYVTVRSTGQVQIRKIVNGVNTVLGTANFTAVPGRYNDVRFSV
jgi:hypothetical protein